MSVKLWNDSHTVESLCRQCVALVESTSTVRRELGPSAARVRAADPTLYCGSVTE